MLIPHKTIVAVLDGRTLDLFHNTGNEAEPDLQPLPTPKLDSHNHSGASHHSVPGNHAAGLVLEDAHAIAATHWLNTEVLSHRIAHLVVIAPPRTLGELRKHYHKTLEAILIKELAKDIVGRNGKDVLEALRAK